MKTHLKLIGGLMRDVAKENDASRNAAQSKRFRSPMYQGRVAQLKGLMNLV